MSQIKTVRAMRKPFYVEAVRVTADNMALVAQWCEGEIRVLKRQNADEALYIQVHVVRPLNDRQTKAFVGDYVLRAGAGWKVYTHKAYKEAFVEIKVSDSIEYDMPILETACS